MRQVSNVKFFLILVIKDEEEFIEPVNYDEDSDLLENNTTNVEDESDERNQVERSRPTTSRYGK